MDALVSYGSGSDSEATTDEEEREQSAEAFLPSAQSLFSKLPPKAAVVTSSVGSERQPTVEEEEVVQRHQWELEEAPKPPPKKPKRSGPVKIVLPELPTAEEGSDDEGEKAAPSTISSQDSGASKIKLLSMLPAPKSQDRGKKLMIPSVVSRPKTETLKKVPNAPGIAKVSKQKSSTKDEEISDSEEAEDFLGLTASNETLEIGPAAPRGPEESYGPSKPPPDLPEYDTEQAYEQQQSSSFPHPSHLYNYVEGGNMEEDKEAGPSSSGISNDRAKHLIYKNELQQWGGQPEDVEIPEIVDVNVDRKLGSTREIRANLLKNLSGRTVGPPTPGTGILSKKEKEKNKPGLTAKRKHQITYLAFMAKQKEESLQDQWANNKFSRAQSRAKYGF